MTGPALSIGLQPTETVRAFETRNELRTTVRWSEMMHEGHASYFTVAKVNDLDLLATLQRSLGGVFDGGGTFEQWKTNIVPELEKAGWWGLIRNRALTGTDAAVLVNERRLRTIYDTNLRMSRAAGRWARIQALKDVAPYLRYSAVMDGRTRPLHRRWHGTILPVDDPWWDTHFPPCGWRCRCTVIQLSDDDLGERGWSVSKRPPELPPRRFYPAGSRTHIVVPAGIDPGFGYNPGVAHLRAVAEKAARSLAAAADVDLAAARATLRELVESVAFDQFMEKPGIGFPVMVLDRPTRELIDAMTPVVTLSSDDLAKQLRMHPEVGIDDYRRLAAIGDDFDIVAREADGGGAWRYLLLAKESDGSWTVAVVKRTTSGEGLFLNSVRIQNARSLRRFLADAEIIHDRR